MLRIGENCKMHLLAEQHRRPRNGNTELANRNISDCYY